MNDFSPYCSVDVASELIACCLAKNVPFYVCRYPDEEQCRFGAQVNTSPVHRLDNGFRVMPFDKSGSDLPFSIYPDTFPADKEHLKALPVRGVEERVMVGEDIDYDHYIGDVKRIVDMIGTGKDFTKLVYSRTITRPCDTKTFLPQYFARLCNLYSTAYVFIVYYPGVCGWIGATPEVLLVSQPQGYATMALAGTRKAGTTGEWGSKEIEEQQYVTQYIADKLQQCGLHDVTMRTYTKQAAQVEHLCTHFDIAVQHDFFLRDQLLSVLHPTPAVAGVPMPDVVRAIDSFEKLPRRYYGGYIGEAFSGGACRLYVNLRSMEFTSDAVRLYVGGGLTAHSIAQDEWNETCAKSQTLLSAF